MVAVRSRYSLGTLPVCSWYGILKVRSHLVFSTRLEPSTRTVRFIVESCNRGLAGFVKYSLLSVLEKNTSLLVILLIVMQPAQSN